MDWLIQRFPNDEKVFVGIDLNGHVRKDSGGYERVHGGQGYGLRNEPGDAIPNFTNTTWFDIIEHLVQKERITLNYL